MLKIVIHGADESTGIPGLETLGEGLEIVFAPDADHLARALPGAEIVYGWDFKGKDLEQCWHLATDLKWIQWCGAGVDAMLFPALVDSEVILTNARGIFDRAMAEYALGLILAQAKDLPTTLNSQTAHRWHYRMTERIDRRRVLVVGAGSIGRAIARLLKAAGMDVAGVGRTARDHDPDFGTVHAIGDLHKVCRDAHWVIGILPNTANTAGVFDKEFFAALPPFARFINLGRGVAHDEAALIAALKDGRLAGAALDVFETEPLPESSPLWDMPNVICSPHMSGDAKGFEEDLVALFADNIARYRAGQPLRNLVDKKLGFAKSQ